MVKLRLAYRQLTSTLPKASCWYDSEPTNSSLVEFDGSEVFCCKKCYKKHGIIFKQGNPSEIRKKYKKILNHTGKSEQNVYEGEFEDGF